MVDSIHPTLPTRQALLYDHTALQLITQIQLTGRIDLTQSANILFTDQVNSLDINMFMMI